MREETVSGSEISTKWVSYCKSGVIFDDLSIAKWIMSETENRLWWIGRFCIQRSALIYFSCFEHLAYFGFESLQNVSHISRIVDPACWTDKVTPGMRGLLLLILPWMCSSDGSPTGRPDCPCIEWANLNQYQVGSVILAERPTRDIKQTTQYMINDSCVFCN